MARKRSYDTLIGGSVGWNQLIQNGDFSEGTTGWKIYTPSNGTLSVNEGTATITYSTTGVGGYAFGLQNYLFKSIPIDHKVIAMADVKPDFACSVAFEANSGLTRYAATTVNTWTKAIVLDRVWSAGATCMLKPVETNIVPGCTLSVRNFMIIDLTLLLGSTIADHVYSLESSTSGAGIAKLREWGFLTEGYIPYNPGTLESVEASAKVTRDASDNIIGNYPLDSSLTLRGIPKLTDGKLWYDGDRYEADGTVTRKYGIRAYQEGDETSDTMITDGTNTVYKLTSTTTESADPFTNPQMVDPDGTEEYVTANGVPVGHETRYQL